MMLLTLNLQLFIIVKPPNASYICICLHLHLAFHDFYNTHCILIFCFLQLKERQNSKTKATKLSGSKKYPGGLEARN